MYIHRDQIINYLLGNVACIADQKYQERVWIKGEGPECDDFNETVCQFFDAADPVLDDYKNFNISDSQYHLLTNFREKFEIFCNDHYEPEQFISSPEWTHISEMAKAVLEAFNYKKIKD